MLEEILLSALDRMRAGDLCRFATFGAGGLERWAAEPQAGRRVASSAVHDVHVQFCQNCRGRSLCPQLTRVILETLGFIIFL